QHDGLTNSEIAEILDIRPSSVTALVNKLVERDFVEKEPLENDKRVTILKLTAKGKQAISHVQTAQESLNQEVFANLTAAEQEQFVHLLTKLLDNLKHIDLRDQRYQALQTYCSPRHHFPRFEPGSWERYSGLKHHHW
ncbi:MarR family transcriptional regulator, partial [Lactobacillus sp. XV13L]|nr:MarR family transcriptional regulator [Lactobacillus sp. XV13L]